VTAIGHGDADAFAAGAPVRGIALAQRYFAAVAGGVQRDGGTGPLLAFEGELRLPPANRPKTSSGAGSSAGEAEIPVEDGRSGWLRAVKEVCLWMPF